MPEQSPIQVTVDALARENITQRRTSIHNDAPSPEPILPTEQIFSLNNDASPDQESKVDKTPRKLTPSEISDLNLIPLTWKPAALRLPFLIFGILLIITYIILLQILSSYKTGWPVSPPTYSFLFQYFPQYLAKFPLR